MRRKSKGKKKKKKKQERRHSTYRLMGCGLGKLSIKWENRIWFCWVKGLLTFQKQTNKKQMEYADSNDNLKTGVFFISFFYFNMFFNLCIPGFLPIAMTLGNCVHNTSLSGRRDNKLGLNNLHIKALTELSSVIIIFILKSSPLMTECKYQV